MFNKIILFVKSILIVIGISIIIYLTFIIITNIPEIFKEEVYYYECVDTFGNEVICEKVYKDYGNMWGIMEDGTAIKLTKAQKINIENN